MSISDGFRFSVLELIFFITFCFQLYYTLRYQCVVIRNNKKEKKGKIKFQNNLLPLSVIISAKDELENLRRFLPAILSQRYPEYEVIVVNDGGDEMTNILISDMQKEYPHLRTTFVPNGAKNLSTKKLALTLGIKAAKYEWLLFTDADCVPESNQWIEHMARNFLPNVDFVLGYGGYFTEAGLLNKLITYDTLFSALQYLGFADAGKPYMGVGRNMAYRKTIFFKQNGFAPSLQILSGDDDIIVNRTATKDNIRIETSLESMTWSNPKKSWHTWYYQKERHLSVSYFYKNSTKWLLLIEPMMRGLFYLSFLSAFIFQLLASNWIVVGLLLGLFACRLIVQSIILNKSASFYKSTKLNLFLLLLFDMVLPLITASILLFGKMGKKNQNISWK